MKCIDLDRLLVAKECNYKVDLKYILPNTATTKDHILIGNPL